MEGMTQDEINQALYEEATRTRTESETRLTQAQIAANDARASADVASTESRQAKVHSDNAGAHANNALVHCNTAQAHAGTAQQAVTDAHTIKAQVQTTAATVQNARGGAADGAGYGGKSKHQVRMPQLKMSYCTAQEFFRFERQARTCARVSQWTDQDEIDNVFGNLLGAASDNIKSMPIQRTSYDNMNMFYKQLRLKFVDSAYQARAREQFAVAVQRHKESLRDFHIRLYSLWFDALAQEEEPWCFDSTTACPNGFDKEQPGSTSKTLISAFLNGLRDPDVKDKIREIKDEIGFKNYEEILQKAVTRESHVTLRRKDRMITQNRDRLQEMYMDTRFDRRPQLNHYQTNQPHYSRAEPMELGLLTRRNQTKKSGPNSKKKGKPQNKRTYSVMPPQGQAQVPFAVPPGYTLTPNDSLYAFQSNIKGQNGKPQGNKYCSFHKTNTHDTSQCRAKSAQGGKNVQWAPRSNSKPRDKTKDKCHVCQKTGHWARDCPEKKKGGVYFVGEDEYRSWAQQGKTSREN